MYLMTFKQLPKRLENRLSEVDVSGDKLEHSAIKIYANT